MSALLLMRHGQASFGDADYDRLTEQGQLQAQATGEYFARAQFRFDAVLVGPKQRHLGTATAAVKSLEQVPQPLTVALLDEFAEASEVLEAARLMAGLSPEVMYALPRAEQLRRYGKAIEAWLCGEVQIEGRPSAAQFRADVARWLHEVVQRPTRGERLLAVTSAGVIAALVAETLRLPVAGMAEVIRVVRNASLSEIVFSAGRVSLLSFNSVAHLPPPLASSM
ncbi:MAG TPA: histidine phosphatase family protein [Burkholderiaceae bacterium]|nr:histidine phosphatase family protein [Burkholderiaceae bacterium]